MKLAKIRPVIFLKFCLFVKFYYFKEYMFEFYVTLVNNFKPHFVKYVSNFRVEWFNVVLNKVH